MECEILIGRVEVLHQCKVIGLRRAAPIAIILVALITVFATCLMPARAQFMGGGVLRGRVLGYTWFDEATPLVWARITAYVGESQVGTISTGSNGSYLMYLPVGRVNITVEYPGFLRQSRFVHVSEGGSTTLDWYLERSELPIPEFSSYHVFLVAAALIGTIQVLLRRRVKRP
jgi:hypothetical protein